MKAPETTTSLCLSVDVVSEVIDGFTFVSQALHRLGPWWLLTLGLVCFSVKSALYAMATSVYGVIAVESLHGFCFAPMWTAAVHLLSTHSPPRLHTTAMSMLWGVYAGVAPALVGILSGKVLTLYGGTGLFLFSGALFGVSAGLG